MQELSKLYKAIKDRNVHRDIQTFAETFGNKDFDFASLGLEPIEGSQTRKRPNSKTKKIPRKANDSTRMVADKPKNSSIINNENKMYQDEFMNNPSKQQMRNPADDEFEI